MHIMKGFINYNRKQNKKTTVTLKTVNIHIKNRNFNIPLAKECLSALSLPMRLKEFTNLHKNNRIWKFNGKSMAIVQIPYSWSIKCTSTLLIWSKIFCQMLSWIFSSYFYIKQFWWPGIKSNRSQCFTPV